MIRSGQEAGASANQICQSIGISLRTLQRWKLNLTDKRKGPSLHPKKITAQEAKRILEVLNSAPYYDFSPHVVFAMLADRGKYLCSVSTMYRLLRKDDLLGHRGRAKRPEKGQLKIETKASKPNQVWCWDITYLRSNVRGHHHKLYLFEDIYSRKIVGYSVEENECEEIARKLLAETLISENISGNGLRVHSDNGQPMRGFTFIERMRSLGVLPTWSRARQSNDNPFPEALFKTMKYTPKYPYRPFDSLESARLWVDDFVKWYNHEHLHSGIGYVTPDICHRGLDVDIFMRRNQLLARAARKKPLRWSKNTKIWSKPEFIELNKRGCRFLD